MGHISLLLLILLVPCSCLQYSQVMAKNDKYITLTANISSFNVSSEFTVMVQATNASQTSYIVAKTSFDDTVDERYSEISFYEEQTPSSDIDLEAATYGQKQYIYLVKENANQSTLYVVVYNVNPFFRREAIEIDLEIVDELVCRGSPPSINCSYHASSCSAQFFGNYCSREYSVIKEVEEGVEFLYTMDQNQFLHVMLDVDQVFNIEFLHQSGYFEIFGKETDSFNFPSYLEPAFKNDQKLFYKVEKTSPSFSLPSGSDKHKLVTFASYKEKASFKIFFYKTPLSFMVIFYIICGSLVGLCILVCCICSACKRISSIRDSRPPEPVYLTAQKFPDFLYREVSDRLASSKPFSLEKLQMIDEKRGDQLQSYFEKVCSICMCEFSFSDEIKVTYCGHLFHTDCLTGWFNKNKTCPCPCCRKGHQNSQINQYYKSIISQYSNAKKGKLDLLEAILKKNHLQN